MGDTINLASFLALLSGIPKALGEAAADFKTYMERMLKEKQAAIQNREPGSGRLMTSFVKALESNETPDDSQKARVPSFDGIIGNILIINFAGYDIIANTSAFAIRLLAMKPEVQDWIGEELCRFATEEDWQCDRAFPRLIRCRAVLVRCEQMGLLLNTKAESHT